MSGGGSTSNAEPSWLWGDGGADLMRDMALGLSEGKIGQGISSATSFGPFMVLANNWDFLKIMSFALNSDHESPVKTQQGLDGGYYNAPVNWLDYFNPDEVMLDVGMNEIDTESDSFLGRSYLRLKAIKDQIAEDILSRDSESTELLGAQEYIEQLLTAVESAYPSVTSEYSLSDLANAVVAAGTAFAGGIVDSAFTAGNVIDAFSDNVATEAGLAVTHGASSLTSAGGATTPADSAQAQALAKAALAVGGLVSEETEVTNIQARIETLSADLQSTAELDLEAGILVLKDSTTGIGSALTAALTFAEGAANSTLIDNAEAAFDAQGASEHARAVSRMAGTMVDINAVNGFAFLLSLSSLERQRQKDTASFRANLATRMYELAFTAYVDTFTKTFAMYLDQYARRMTYKLDLLKTSMSVKAQVFMSAYRDYIATYSGLLGVHSAASNAYLQNSTSASTNAYNAFTQAASSLAGTYMDSGAQIKADRLRSRDSNRSLLVDETVKLLTYGISTEAAITEKIVNHQNLRAEAKYTAFDKAVSYDRLDRLWRLDVLGKGMNYLGSSTGISTSNEVSPAAKIVGGAMSGAGIGASVGAGIPGAVIGAVLGGIGGAIS